MPPFRSWMPPKVIAEAALWGDRMLGSDMSASAEELSTLKYSFPDALPKVTVAPCLEAPHCDGITWRTFLYPVTLSHSVHMRQARLPSLLCLLFLRTTASVFMIVQEALVPA